MLALLVALILSASVHQDEPGAGAMSHEAFDLNVDQILTRIDETSGVAERAAGMHQLIELANEAYGEGSLERVEILLEIGAGIPSYLLAVVEVYRDELSAKSVSDARWIRTHAEAAQRMLANGQLQTAAHCLEAAESRSSQVPLLVFWIETLWCKLDLLSGRFAKAHERCAKLEGLLESGDLKGWEVEASTNLASLYADLGRFEDCRQIWDEFVERAEHDGDLHALQRALIDRCNARRAERDFEGIVVDARRALATELESGLDHTLEAHYHLGVAYTRLEQVELARESFEFVIQNSDSRPKIAAAAYSGLATLTLETGEPHAAKAYLDAALRLEREMNANEFLLHSLQTLIRIETALGNATEARKAIAEAERHLESHQVLAGGARLAGQLRSQFARFDESCADFIASECRTTEDEVERSGLAEEGLRYACRWNGRTLADSLTTQSGLANTAERALTTASIRLALPPAGALVHYVNGEEALYAYVVTAERVSLIDLGPRNEIEVMSSAFVEDVLRNVEVTSPAGVAFRGLALHEKLVEPLRASMPESLEVLYVVTTPALSALPFDALVSAAPGPGADSFREIQFLLDETTIVHAPTAWLLPLLDKRPDRDSRGPALLIGDPVFPTEAAASKTRSAGPDLSSLERLIATREEVLEAALELVPELARSEAFWSRFGPLSNSNTRDIDWSFPPYFQVYSGAHADDRWYRGDPRRYELLHFATHSFENERDPSSVALLVSGDTVDERLLTVGEIRDLDLDPQLVVLSACSTATGPNLRGDGVQSLANAFFDSGAREVVASLTKVEDEAARDLITTFYQQRRGGLSTREALRLAKMAQRRRTKGYRGFGKQNTGSAATGLPPGHPYTWAPFVYMGR